MELVVRLIGAKDALEVGTFIGYSAIRIARGLREDARLTCLELDEGSVATTEPDRRPRLQG
jgi:caffeoyl-CoA O-methyltransferase